MEPLHQDLIASIRARAADPERRTDAPPSTRGRTVSYGGVAMQGLDLDAVLRGDPNPGVPANTSSLPGTVDPARLDAVAAQLGFAVPTQLRQLYLEVADGCFGPGAGLLPLSELVRTYVDLRANPPGQSGQAWPPHLLPMTRTDASHELRTPTAVIRATAELALRHQREPAAYREAIQSIKEQSIEMSAMIENMLDLARSEARHISSSFTRVNLAALLQNERPHIEARAEAHPLDWALTCPDEPAFILGDAASLRRLLTILVDNAFKFTPAPGRVDIQVSLLNTGQVTLDVSDTGVGISPEAIPRIYDRFFQADPSRSSPGTGLGLSLARWIVLSQGAAMDVDSSPGNGARFRVRFPAAHQALN